MSIKEIKKDIACLLRARCSLIWIVTAEEETAEAGIIEACAMARYGPEQVFFWDCSSGILDYEGNVYESGATLPESLFRYIEKSRDRAVYVARDLHDWLDPVTKRQVRTLARRLAQSPPGEARNLIVLSPSNEIPPELKDSVVLIDWPLPDREEVGMILDQSLERLPPKERNNLTLNGQREQAIDAAIGLTAQGVARCFSRSLVSTRSIDPGLIHSEKKRAISSQGLLTWYDPNPRGMRAIGGLERVKRDIVDMGALLGQDARDFGIPPPKGLIAGGAPGCGKSLLAQCVPAAWNIPLLRMDFGGLQSKYVGESQQNLRGALKLAEVAAPIVLWVDECDKAFAGATGPAGDGGVAADAIGYFLSWLQENIKPVFVIMTANNLITLNRTFPELFRAGRWDAVYFIDLPHKVERYEIFVTTLEGRKRDPGALSLDYAVDQTSGFSGAEIAATVDKALKRAFLAEKRALCEQDLIEAAGEIVPLSQSAAESLRDMRAWSTGRALPASDPYVESTVEAAPGKGA